MAPAAWLLLGVLARALPHWHWSVLWTTLTPTGGGLRDQIFGTLILMLGVFLIAGTIGVLAGIHLAELALVLAVISVAVNLIARLIIARTGRIGAPVGGA